MGSYDRYVSRFDKGARGSDPGDASVGEPGSAPKGLPPGELGQEILGPERPGGRSRDPRKKLSRWLEKRATRVVGKVYEDRAEDLQQRAARTIGSIYEERADDLEDRAVRAMRRAIEGEADRIRIAIEHGVEVKKREVRLSLLVLVISSMIYVVLYLLTR